MKVENKVSIHKINGGDVKVGENIALYVRNVWNSDRLVELQINGETVIQVHEADLVKAIKNATNNERY